MGKVMGKKHGTKTPINHEKIWQNNHGNMGSVMG